jgi:RNA-directed DNA polymerase
MKQWTLSAVTSGDVSERRGYFRLAQTPGVWKDLGQWMRHRVRAIQLKHWKRGTTTYRELLALGRSPILRDR